MFDGFVGNGGWFMAGLICKFFNGFYKIAIMAICMAGFGYGSAVRVKGSLPLANNIFHSGKRGEASVTGAYGFGIGYENNIGRSSFLCINMSETWTFAWNSIPEFYDYYDPIAIQGSISAQYYRWWGRWSVGLGPMIDNMFYRKGMDSVYHSSLGMSLYNAVGTHTAVEYTIFEPLFATLDYRANLYNLTTNTVKYSHAISLAITFKTKKI